jgi:hypothetical protein
VRQQINSAASLLLLSIEACQEWRLEKIRLLRMHTSRSFCDYEEEEKRRPMSTVFMLQA